MAAQADARDYVRARAAAADGAVAAAAAGYAAALAAAPGDEVVALRAYRNALASGDLALARHAGAVLTRSGVAPADVPILDLAFAIRGGSRDAVDDALDRIGAGPIEFLVPVIRAWLARDRGRDAIAVLNAADGEGLGGRYIAEHRALILIAQGRIDEGMSALRVALAADLGSLDLRWNAAILLAAKGKRALAQEVLAGESANPVAFRDKLRRGPKANAAFGASRAFTRLAADLTGQETAALSIALTRAALLLDPGDDPARLLLAGALAHERAWPQALAALDAMRSNSPFYTTALAERIEITKTRGEPAAALALAASLAAHADATPDDRQLYADLLSDAERYAEAATLYATALADAGPNATWVQHLQLGGALERAGDWDAALPHLRKAAKLAPEQAVALNYLGYSLADRGEQLEEARDLLERASKLRPDDPAITDSLGWVYYRSGRFERAVPLLERAAQGDPASVTINEHLGDAYWRVGRRFEARYAWRAAALYAEGEEQTRIAAKLRDGLKPGNKRTAVN